MISPINSNQIQEAIQEACGHFVRYYGSINQQRSEVLVSVSLGQMGIAKDEELKNESPNSIVGPLLYKASTPKYFTQRADVSNKISFINDLALEIIIRNGDGWRFPNSVKRDFNRWETGALVRKLFWNLRDLRYTDEDNFRSSELGKCAIKIIYAYKSSRK